MACFSEGRNSSQFFIAWKAGYNHPPPLDSWRQLIIRRPKTHVWCFYLVREAQLYQAIPRRLFLYKEILSPTGWDLICLYLQMMWGLNMGNCIDRALRENLKRWKSHVLMRLFLENGDKITGTLKTQEMQLKNMTFSASQREDLLSGILLDRIGSFYCVHPLYIHT